MTESSRIVVARGPRAAEARLLAEVDARLPRGRLPVRSLLVVVPSHRLREHVLGRLATRRPAWIGLEVATLAGATAAILARTAPAPVPGREVQAVLVRRLAAREPALARALGGLQRGYDEVAGGVRDLLDAGFVEEHLEALTERLELERRAAGNDAVERAMAIARVAAAVRRELAELGLVPPADLLAEAARRLAADPERALPGRACIVHGFAEVTGVGADLLEALVRHRSTLVLFDRPPELDGTAASWRFGARLLERLSGLAPLETDPGYAPAAAIEVLRAADPAREARAAAAWLAGAGDGSPESSAIVAREPGTERGAWHRELDRLGGAASAESATASAPARRRAALLEALAAGADLDAGVALALGDERIARSAGVGLAELRLAYAQLGARTLDAAADLAAASVRLPVPARVRTSEIAPDAPGSIAERTVPAGALAASSRWLARLRDELARQRAARSVAERLRDLRALLAHALPETDLDEATNALEPLARPELARLVVDAEEWRLLVEECWRPIAAAPLGGGGGFALLSVTEARGRTFDRLALVGLTRDRFPRAVRPDPMLPDALRLRLRELLPDLPVKAEGHDEERFLFAQLLASAPELALMRAETDGQGRKSAPSPLLDELVRARALAEVAAPPPRRASALDRAVGSALVQGPRGLGGALDAAIAEGERRFGRGTTDAAAAAAARTALLAELGFEPGSPRFLRLGPYAGSVGPLADDDPRSRAPSATTLEAIARCGWRAFLERVLEVRALPELGDPLPSLPRRLVGNVVHEVLEALAPGRRGLELDVAAGLPPLRVPWPSAAELARLVRQRARSALVGESLDPGLFETVLVREALARLEVARETDWRGGAVDLLGVEVHGQVAVVLEGVERRLPFRADRVERGDQGVLLTDYKTGRLLSHAVGVETRARHLGAAIARGEAMQLPLYLLAAGSGARARYLFLDPEADDRTRDLGLELGDLDRGGFEALLATLFEAWSAGAFPPRLFEPDRETSYSGCGWCEVREACHQGDSSARLRFAAWLGAAPAASDPLDRAARAWWEVRGASAGEDAEP